MKNLIITFTDAKFGDFTINHWLKSLKENVNLKNINAVILDYGMTDEQIEKLKKEGAIVVKCVRDGHVTAVRHRDMRDYLAKNKGKYDQILMTDGGDIIFQGDISGVLQSNKDDFWVVLETYNMIDFSKIFLDRYFKKEDAEKMKKALNGKKMINAGVIFAAAKKMEGLCGECYKLILEKNKFGPDQVAVNYILYREGFHEIDERYNFITSTSKNMFKVKEGAFYFKQSNKIIPIVHNAGWKPYLRSIKNFGYGKEYNKTKLIYLSLMRAGAKIKNKLKAT